LDGVCIDLDAYGRRAPHAVAASSTGTIATWLAPGICLRQIDIPIAAMMLRSVFRQIFLDTVGRSARCDRPASY